jgi:hypothetical protein
MALDPNTVNLMTAAIPAVIEIVKLFHAHANPGADPLTEEQALAALHQAVGASLAKDEAIASAASLGVHAGSTGE